MYRFDSVENAAVRPEAVTHQPPKEVNMKPNYLEVVHQGKDRTLWPDKSVISARVEHGGRRNQDFTVYRVPVWNDQRCERSDHGMSHDFAIVWDEDRDQRVFQVVDKLYWKGLLSGVYALGESEGVLSLVTEPGKPTPDRIQRQLGDTVELVGDVWSVQVGPMDDPATEAPIDYISAIHQLFQLGPKIQVRVVRTGQGGELLGVDVHYKPVWGAEMLSASAHDPLP